MDTILEVKNITKRFFGMTAIDHLSLEFKKKELRCIIGPNGSGKTTLFNMITGAFPPSEGKIYFEGKDITKKSVPQIARLGICRKFQNPNIFSDISVEDNLRVAAISEHRIASFFRKNDDIGVEEQIDEALDRIELTDKKSWTAGSLSHGQKQWLEIGMVLIKKPKIILLDEPTAGMTSQETSRTSDLIREISKETTCVVIEHDLDFIRSLHGHVTVLNRGRFLAEGTYEEIAKNKEVRDVYLGDEE